VFDIALVVKQAGLRPDFVEHLVFAFVFFRGLHGDVRLRGVV
jgi:hypothetical protein